MHDLAGQIVEHFPTEDKVFSKNNEVLKEHIFFKDLFSNSRRNLGIIVMVPSHTVDYISVLETHVERWRNKPTTHPLQKLALALRQVKMKTPIYLMLRV